MEHERSAPILAHTSLASAPPRQALARLLVGAPVVGIVAVDETDELSTKRGEVGPGMPPLLVGRSRPRLRAGRWWTNARRPCVARRWLTSFEKEAHSPSMSPDSATAAHGFNSCSAHRMPRAHQVCARRRGGPHDS
jgi:hypothetical protein